MKSKCPEVSIIMSVHNGENFVTDAINSILNQTFRNFEFLIFDDGSNDKTLKEIRKFKDKRIKIFYFKKNMGLAYRLNQGIGLAKGKYIARMDDDDISHPNRLKYQLEFLEKNPFYDLISSKCLTISKNNEVIGELPFRENHEEICKYPFISFHHPHPSWFGRKKWFKKNLYSYPSSYFSEDQELLLKTYKKSKFYSIPEYLLAYRLKENIPLIKLFKINKALFLSQIKQFYNGKNLLYIFPSIIIFLLRILKIFVPFLNFVENKKVSCKQILIGYDFLGNKIDKEKK